MTDVNNVVEIRKALLLDVKASVTPNVYYEDAPVDATYPYLILSLIDSNYDGASTEVFDLYVNGWDDDSDTTALETLMYNLNELINDKVYPTPGTSFSFRSVLDKKLTINDPDSLLKRREYRYSVRAIQRR